MTKTDCERSKFALCLRNVLFDMADSDMELVGTTPFTTDSKITDMRRLWRWRSGYRFNVRTTASLRARKERT